MSDKPIREYPLQTAIELACAAERANNGYIRDGELLFTTDNLPRIQYSNKELMLVAIGEIDTKKYEEHAVKPVLLCTNLDDQEKATEIRKYFKRLLFKAIEGDDEFKTNLFLVLSKDVVPMNKLGFVACLPQAYRRDKYMVAISNAGPGYIADVGTEVVDLDCEIISSKRSKNYDAWNTEAIIDNKLVSWMGKQSLTVGPCVLIKGKVKDHSRHWNQPVDVTRLNYVKAFQ